MITEACVSTRNTYLLILAPQHARDWVNDARRVIAKVKLVAQPTQSLNGKRAHRHGHIHLLEEAHNSRHDQVQVVIHGCVEHLQCVQHFLHVAPMLGAISVQNEQQTGDQIGQIHLQETAYKSAITRDAT